jgi:hypothetical protein
MIDVDELAKIAMRAWLAWVALAMALWELK